MKHHRWIEKSLNHGINGNDEFNRGEYWRREIKCPKCGYTTTDIMMRRKRALAKEKKKNDL